jgi:predicted methyltransferase
MELIMAHGRLAAPIEQFAMRTHLVAAVLLASLVGACAVALPDTPATQTLISDPLRTDRDRELDASRKPADFLAFTEVKPGMRVLDVSAGAGYTTQLMALAVGPGGKVWAQSPNPGPALTKRLAEHPQANITVAKRPFADPVPDDATNLDLVTLVNNYHDISYLPVDRDRMNARLFAALKPGGRYVIMDHAALAGSGLAAGKTLHRIEEDFVVAEVLKAGFVLDARGSFLRNPQDTREKPSTAAEQASDKFVLRFVKAR